MDIEKVNGKANAALTTGIIGTALSGLEAIGGVGALLGMGQKPPADPGDRPVTRYEMGLMNENRDLRDRLTLMEANHHSDAATFALQRQIDGQGAINAAMNVTLANQQSQLNQLFGITRLTIPNQNLNPGYGPALVAPMMPYPPFPPLTQTTVQSGTQSGTEAAGNG